MLVRLLVPIKNIIETKKLEITILFNNDGYKTFMNILFVSYKPFNPSFGGIERVTDILTKALLERGHQVYYLCNYMENLQMLAYDFPVPLFMLPSRGEFQSKDNMEFYINLLSKLNIDIVVNQQGLFPYWYETLLYSTRSISVLHAMPDYSIKTECQRILRPPLNIIDNIKYLIKLLLYPFLCYKVKSRLEPLLAKHYAFIVQHSDAVVLLSERYIADFRKYCPIVVDDNKIKGIPNPNTFSLQSVKFDNKEKIILYVGRLEGFDKCPMRILKIWKLLYKKFPDWQLLVIGDGPERQPMQDFIDKHSLMRVTLLGRKSNVEDYYKRASMICLTSTSEGWGMVLTEGMQFGCIPLAFDNSKATYDIIDDGITGFIIPSFNLKSYVNRLSLLMADKEKRINMALAALNKSKEFDVTVIAEQWERLFNDICGD